MYHYIVSCMVVIFSLHKQKFQTLPGTFSISMHPLVQQLTGVQIHSHIIAKCYYCYYILYLGTLTSSLVPVAPFATEEASAFPDQLTKEVKEFAPLKAYHPHLHYYPHTTYVNTLYVYPLSLKYDTQKMFTKVSTIITATKPIKINLVNTKLYFG